MNPVIWLQKNGNLLAPYFGPYFDPINECFIIIIIIIIDSSFNQVWIINTLINNNNNKNNEDMKG